MKFLIIEDEPLAAERLGNLLLQQYPQIEKPITCDSVESAVSWLKDNPMPSCIFMDIQLSDGLSFSISHDVEITCPVIFTTAYENYALKAFELFSIDYLLKPVTLKSLKQALHKLETYTYATLNAQQNLLDISESKYKNRFLIKVGNKMFFVDVKDIAYFMSDDKSVYLYTTDGKSFIIDYTLDGLMELLNEKEFFRLNRQVIARIDAIKDIKLYTNRRLKLTLNSGNAVNDVIVSRERVSAFKTWAGN
ncbi:LytR/AlgR family response regulator transcription factor [Pedobacter puniceum]|uniref:Response regulator n=1 Tax=Pedobacter puniceum TaxID=2666136 RepID=A0A7K0FKC8_9SPHI|nr:LytTR family DNA-binding domain-containing protein [Pedobacter puniceum]MRX46091.1 response regulator [Pedobacter puniceum]